MKTGLYAKIRHPIYTSMILYYLGLILVFFNLLTALLYLLLLGILVYTAISEENFLKGKFKDCEEYMKRTGRFFPRF